MLQVMQGFDPNAKDPEPQAPLKAKTPRVAPSPDKLAPLTPEAFDAMFPGKATH